jgi:hypothetical protein
VHRYVYFQKQKLVSIREKSKHTSEEKIGKQRNPNKKNKKQICTEGASENLMLQISWETEKSRKILNLMGKQSYSWYLGSGLIQIHLSLYFPFNIFMTILCF